MKKLAINTENGTVIEVVSVSGGWTTCRDIEQGFEFKLRNGKIGEFVEPTEVAEDDADVLAAKAAEALEEITRKPEYLAPAGECPVCGSDGVYHGVIGKDGCAVVNEDTDWGCHHCDFKMKIEDYPELKKKLVNADLEHYVRGAGVTNSGRPTVDIDDPVARTLRGEDLGVIYPLVVDLLIKMGRETMGRGAKKMDITEENLRKRYGHLNIGMQRMNLGNILRGAMNDLGLDELPL